MRAAKPLTAIAVSKLTEARPLAAVTALTCKSPPKDQGLGLPIPAGRERPEDGPRARQRLPSPRLARSAGGSHGVVDGKDPMRPEAAKQAQVRPDAAKG